MAEELVRALRRAGDAYDEEGKLATAGLLAEAAAAIEAAACRRDAALARAEKAEAERDAALKRAEAAERPDMFWWGDDPEQPHQSVHDLIVAFDVQAGEVALVQRASRLPDQWFVWGPQPAEGEDFDAYPGLKAFDTEAEAKAYAATLSQPGAAS